MAGKRKAYPDWVRWSGVGIEFAAAVAVFAFIGFWIDRKYDSAPWGVLVGAALGLIGGTYNLIRDSLAAFRQPPQSSRQDQESPDRSGETGQDQPDDGPPPNEP